ncbi:MAG: c-type cytochrome, partial [Planctomycetota bacterium]|nr:c-type cytochrome [Planctomycetota bacterium]
VVPRLRPDDVPKAITTLTARPASARRLLKAIGEEQIASDWIGAYEWRQLLSLNQDDLTREVYKLWPESQTWDDLEGQLQRVARLLTEENLAQADMQQGAALFRKNCANCHRLLGEGALIGPDLTGGQRGNLRYLLQNIITPSEEVATNYRTSLFEMADGQVIVGVVLNQLPDRLTVQTQEAVVTLSRSEIEDRQESSQSLMPNGLLNGLSDQEIVALFSFLKSAG